MIISHYPPEVRPRKDTTRFVISDRWDADLLRRNYRRMRRYGVTAITARRTLIDFLRVGKYSAKLTRFDICQRPTGTPVDLPAPGRKLADGRMAK